jgi:hypothetical protein
LPFEAPIVHVNESLVVAASWRDVFFIVWQGAAGVDVLRTVVAHELSYVRRLRGRKLAVMTVIPSTTLQLPDAATREVMDGARRELNPVTKAYAIVLPTTGFTTAAIRAMVGGMMLLQRPTYPAKVLEGLQAAFAWMAPLLDPDSGQALTPADLAAAYAALPCAARSSAG